MILEYCKYECKMCNNNKTTCKTCLDEGCKPVLSDEFFGKEDYVQVIVFQDKNPSFFIIPKQEAIVAYKELFGLSNKEIPANSIYFNNRLVIYKYFGIGLYYLDTDSFDDNQKAIASLKQFVYSKYKQDGQFVMNTNSPVFTFNLVSYT